jgi:prevent-host-death family protein
MPQTRKKDNIVIPALTLRKSLGMLLRRVERDHGSLVIEKRGTPRAVLLSIRDYVRLAAPEPHVLTVLGHESKIKGTDKLSARQIEKVIRDTRSRRKPRSG